MKATRPPGAIPETTTPVRVIAPNGRFGSHREYRARVKLVASWSLFGPYIISSFLLLLGYLHYAPGAAYSLSAQHYRAWSFPSFRYSDLIWLYLRDGLDGRPLPYVDYPLEYPPLTGLASWLLSWAPDLPGYFTLAYVLLAASALFTVWALQHLSGANVWLFAVSPALFFYTGHQWDIAAIGVAAVSLLALQRGRDGWGVAGLVVATSLKLFPVVFVAAAVIERIRDRRYRSAAAISLGFAAGTLAINLPIALVSFEGWSFFFRWNRDRLADSGIWILWRDVSTADLTRWSLVAAIAGGLSLTALALRSRGPIAIPLGATYLLWWLLVNKTFTTHLMLWALLSLALLSAPWWLWGMTTAADLVGFQLGNYLNLYNVPDFQSAPLIRKAVENIYDPMQIARSVVLLISTLWGVHVLRTQQLRANYAGSSTANRVRPPARRHAVVHRDVAAVGFAVWSAFLRGSGVALGFAAATILMTWPLAANLGSGTIVGFDPYLQIWLSEWIQHALRTNPLGLYDANIFYPFAQTLAYTDANVPGALIAAPLRLLTGDPLLTNSLLVLATFVLAGSGVYALIAYLTENQGAAFISGVAYAFLPYRMVHLWHLNWLEGALLPWVVLALLRLIDCPSVGRGILLGLLAAILVLTSFYFSVQVALIVAVMVGAWSFASRRRPSIDLWRGLAVATAVALFIVVPLYVPYLQVREEQKLERTIVDAEQYKALPVSYLQLAPWHVPNLVQRFFGVRAGPNESLTEVGQAQHADGHQHGEIVIEDALYPGVIAIVFAAIGFAGWRSRRWFATAVAAIGSVAFILSLGPSLGPRHGDGMSLPYGWLFDHVPFFRAMRVPARLGGLVDLAIVLLAGLGIAVAWNHLRSSPRLGLVTGRPWAGPALTLILAGIVLADMWTGAIPIEAVDRGLETSAAARWLATQPPGPVMEFPAESVFADPAAASVRRHNGETMFWSTLHWNPLVNGNSGFIPRAYSDFIEEFVGEIARPNGATTPRISHLDADSARLLQQIGVRYLVFHRSQYAAEDWPTVAAQLDALAENGDIMPVGEKGESSVFVLSPAVPAVEELNVSLFAPTLIAPGSIWAPWVAIENRSKAPSVLALTKPPRLETTWYDGDGKRLWSGSQQLRMPVVLEDPRLLCGADDCLTSRPFDDLSRLPPPETEGSWQPEQPGHYVVKLQLTGDHPLDCRVDLDVVADAADAWKRSGTDVHRWARCVAGHPNPVNNPGALPFDLSPPAVTLIDTLASLDITMTTRQDEEVRGWFTLAPPGSAQPWNEATYQSPAQQKLVPRNEPTAFEWQAPLGVDVAPGVYGLTVWFHRRGESSWEHATGGDIGVAPIVVDKDGALRWAGPIRIRLAGQPRSMEPGQTSTLDLAVIGASNRQSCVSSWQLFQDREVIAHGNGGSCDEPEIAVPATTPPGQYRLEIDAYVEQGADVRLSDGVSIPISVVQPTPSGSAT